MMGFSMTLGVAFLNDNSGATVSGTSSARPRSEDPTADFVRLFLVKFLL